MRRLATASLVAGLWLIATGPAAGAHGNLRHSEPAGGAVLERPPRAVQLEFSEPPDQALSAVEVMDTSGRRVERAEVQPVAGRPLALQVPVGSLPSGTYTVSWRIVSRVDGHTTTGVFTFGVGKQAPGAMLAASSAAAGERRGDPLSPLGVAGRWAIYWGFALLIGAAATGMAVFGRRLPGRPGRLLVAALLLAGAGLAAMAVAVKTMAGVSFLELARSGTGLWLLGRGAALLVAGVAVAAVLARPRSGWPLVLLGLAAGGGLLVHALAGHASAASSLRWLNLAAQWAHLVAVGVWIGGLAWLLQGISGQDRPEQVAASLRFSRLAAGGLAVVVVTGLARTLDELGGWGRLVDSGYGRTLALKLALFTGLLGLGALNRYRVLPALAAGTSKLARLRGTVRGELGLAAVVLAAAALLSELPPGQTVGPPAAPPPPQYVQVSGSDYATTMRVMVTISPGRAGPNRFAAQVADYDTGAPIEAERLRLSASLPARPEMEPATLDLARHGVGPWHGEGSLLSIAGRWELTALVQTRAGATTVPLQVDVGRPALGDAHASGHPGS